jgi:nanoRNase/pAp phosphatase (c-di-AMP/oligoRNAs hydrolase)
MGLYNGSLLLSLRTAEEDAHAGQIIRRVVAGLGRAGGHGAMAGGQIPLSERDYGEVAAQIKARLADELANETAEEESLVL